MTLKNIDWGKVILSLFLFFIGAWIGASMMGWITYKDSPRPKVIHICSDGTRIYRQPDGKITFYQRGGAFFDAGAGAGELPRGMKPEEFCK